jgi:hypothetical protein
LGWGGLAVHCDGIHDSLLVVRFGTIVLKGDDMTARGSNALTNVWPITYGMCVAAFTIVILTCSGVRGVGDGDADQDANSHIDADAIVNNDAYDDTAPLPNDLDNDGVAYMDDCNDCNSGTGPGFTDPCGNGFDEDCSGSDLMCEPDDADGDGYATAPTGLDCDDTDSHTYPGALDACDDGVAQDCALDRPCGDDADGDHFTAEDDCDDTNPNVHPWAEEICDPAGVDEDCDGQVNEVNVDADRFGCTIDPSTGLWQTVDFMTDVRHCGRCRNDCISAGTGTRCSAGVCE